MDGRHNNALNKGHLLVDRYQIVRPLGHGSLATTYLAHDRLWDHQVALKLLHRQSHHLLDALQFEFSVLRGLFHPHLAIVHDFAIVREPHACFYTADYIEGMTLDRFARGKPWAEVQQPLCDALVALRVLHRLGIRHGDFKPTNLLVRPNGRGVLIDLSCSRPIHTQHPSLLAGTPEFLPPEALSGAVLDHRTDLYAVGITLCHLRDHLSSAPPSHVAKLISRLTHRSAHERPANVGELLDVFGIDAPDLKSVATGRIVGREKELSAAREVLHTLLAGTPGPRVLHFVGNDGVGRTRLLQEIKWDAQQHCRVLETNPSAPSAITALLSCGLGTPIHDEFSLIACLNEDRQRHGPPLVFVVDDIHRLADRQLDLLRAFARGLESDTPMLVIAAGPATAAIEAAHGRREQLQPLSRDAVAQWMGDSFGPSLPHRLHRLTGGFPSAIRLVLHRLSSGELTESDIEPNGGIALSDGVASDIKALPPEEQRAIGVLALMPNPVQRRELECLMVSLDAMETLASKAMAEPEAGGWKLVRPTESRRIEQLLGGILTRSLHNDVAAWFESRLEVLDETDLDEGARLRARHVQHLVGAARIQRATEAFCAAKSLHAVAPSEWWNAATCLRCHTDSPEVYVAIAKLAQLVGRTQEGLTYLQRALDCSHSSEFEAEIRLELAASYINLGDVSRAEHELAHCQQATTKQTKASALYLLARARNKQGSFREALKIADQAMVLSEEQLLRADIQEVAAVALSCLGDWEHARQRLDQAMELFADLKEPSRLARIHGSRGLVQYNMGNLEAAERDYQKALALADRGSLSHQLATAALNYGTVCHQRGRWASALDSYERGLRMATALGQAATEALLRFNLSKLFADLGAFDRAEAAVSRCEDVANNAELPLIVAVATTVRAEVLAARGEQEAAAGHFAQAREAVERLGSVRDGVEVDLQMADLAIARNQLGAADKLLHAAEATMAKLDAKDIQVRLELTRARLLHSQHSHMEAISYAKRAAAGAECLGSDDLAAEAHLLMAHAWERHGSTSLAAKHRIAAQETWETLLAPLPAGMRDAFWRHPKRLSHAQHAQIAPPKQTHQHKWELLADINKRMNASLKTRDVLRQAMDAAIELTGAERGFLLIASKFTPSRLTVRVARNVDGEPIDRSHMKFSRGIAEQVVVSRTPMITANAQSDARLRSTGSVHAMHLKSVACVPIIAQTGVLGALYLDNRFQAGRFTDNDLGVLVVFADQVAIALTNARLHHELQQRNQELEAEKLRVEELLQGQAIKIEELSERVKPLRSRVGRFDYPNIVGTSRAMADMFALLDRVIDTGLTILIQGESGTGKELVAKAIHDNSPRRDGPMVSINCAAVPEALLESELFGYDRGAFTGADRRREGLFARAKNGTLFLDELGDMPPSMQAKLLRVLQEREVCPLGSAKPIRVDFRLVSATNRCLREEVKRGSFREDLFYRVAAVEVNVPPLRNRTEDIPPLVHHILLEAAARTNRPPPQITRQALTKLAGFAWPGNVRQLENVVTKALVLADTERVTASDIDVRDDIPQREPPSTHRLGRSDFEQRERAKIESALEANRWNVAKVSRELGIPRVTLYRKLQRYGFSRNPDRG